MDEKLFLGHRPHLISLCLGHEPYFPLLRWLLIPERLPLGLSGVVCGLGPELALSFSTYPEAIFTYPRFTACRGGLIYVRYIWCDLLLERHIRKE